MEQEIIKQNLMLDHPELFSAKVKAGKNISGGDAGKKNPGLQPDA